MDAYFKHIAGSVDKHQAFMDGVATVICKHNHDPNMVRIRDTSEFEPMKNIIASSLTGFKISKPKKMLIELDKYEGKASCHRIDLCFSFDFPLVVAAFMFYRSIVLKVRYCSLGKRSNGICRWTTRMSWRWRSMAN